MMPIVYLELQSFTQNRLYTGLLSCRDEAGSLVRLVTDGQLNPLCSSNCWELVVS